MFIAMMGLFVAVFIGGGRYARLVWATIVAAIALPLVGSLLRHAMIAVLLQAVGVWGIVWFLAVASRSFSSQWVREAENALILRPPFEGAWRVVAGGPSRANNHHLVATAQVYAYDFTREDDETMGSRILAPVSGPVVARRDGMRDHPSRDRVYQEVISPLGNYVAIDSGRGVVYLAHLQRGSVCVSVGDRTSLGQPVGICGNSGRTTRSHLHIHAQDRKGEHRFLARAVAIAFIEEGVSARLLDFDDEVYSRPHSKSD